MEIDFKFDSKWELEKLFSSLHSNFLKGPKSKNQLLSIPKLIEQSCPGVKLRDHTVKSLLFSTDMALIENYQTDGLLAVYPYPPSVKIMKCLIDFSERPVICGIGGGLTQGKIALEMAGEAENLGAIGLIVNQPFKNRDIELIKKKIRIPLISTVSVLDFPFQSRIDAGVDVFHVAGGDLTSGIINKIKRDFPGFPVMATGGKSVQSVQESFHCGADSIVISPPTSAELYRKFMNSYRGSSNFWKRLLQKIR